MGQLTNHFIHLMCYFFKAEIVHRDKNELFKGIFCNGCAKEKWLLANTKQR